MKRTKNRKRTLTTKEKSALLERQGCFCFWCLRPFGDVVEIRRRGNVVLVEVGEHVIPYCYTQKTLVDDIVLSCQICNESKSSFIFPTVEACREYLKDVWESKLVTPNIKKKIESQEPAFTDDEIKLIRKNAYYKRIKNRKRT